MKRTFVTLLIFAVLTVGAISVEALTVYDIRAYPNVITSYTYFTATTVPSQTPLDEIEYRVYNLYSQLVASKAVEDVYQIYWDGDDLANGIYMYTVSYVNLNPDLSDEFGPYVLYILK